MLENKNLQHIDSKNKESSSMKSKDIEAKDIEAKNTDPKNMGSKNLILNKIQQYSAYYKHPSYYLERKTLNAMQRGLTQEALTCLNAINGLERAKLADTPLRSIKNSLIASCTLFTRAAIEANVPPEEAFSHSDVHILEIERFASPKHLQKYEYTMLEDYMNLIQKYKVLDYSALTMKMIEYIHENITDSINLTGLADELKKNKTYLCAHFKQEVGMNIMDYVNYTKAEESKYFLRYGNLTISEIAFMFNFCNPGYYTKVFKKVFGITPSAFRLSPVD